MQGLVYILIALAALGVAAAVYFGLTFTPIEAVVAGMCFGAVAVVLMERRLRQRSEARLERAIEDLARLLSTDAQAGQVLSQRINQLADSNAASRLDSIEADISVLGTVVRQVAEAVAEMEEARRTEAAAPATVPATPAKEDDEDTLPEPVIPVEMLREALDAGRLVCHIAPIVRLPDRVPHGYDVVPRLVLEDAEFADPPDFVPGPRHADLVRRIEAEVIDQAVMVARRARTAGRPIRLYLPLSREMIAEATAFDRLNATLDANRAISESLVFSVTQGTFRQLMPSQKIAMDQLRRHGAGFSLAEAGSLRFDFGELQALGFTSVRIGATRFLRDPEAFTDFHPADVAAYAGRFGMDVIATGVIDNKQALALFELGIGLLEGPHIARPGPVHADLIDTPSQGAPLRRVEG